jgi:hypothetical protein
MKKLFYIIGLALICFLFSCEKEQDIVPMNGDEKIQPSAEANPEEIIIVPINPLTGEPEVQNFDFEDAVQDAENIFKAVGGQIIDDQEIRLGSDPNHGLEVDGRLPAGYVLTGIGARVNDGRITTLVMEGRYVNSDGTMGTRMKYRFGTEPNHGLEVWYSVPNQCVITGFGGRISDNNITTMHLRYRELNSNLRLSDSYNTVKVGSAPNHSLEANFLPINYSLDVSRIVLTRVGMREASSNLTTLHVWASTLR